MTGGIEAVTTFVQDLPKTLTGRDEGNFDQEKLRKAYDRAVAYAGQPANLSHEYLQRLCEADDRKSSSRKCL